MQSSAAHLIYSGYGTKRSLQVGYYESILPEMSLGEVMSMKTLNSRISRKVD